MEESKKKVIVGTRVQSGSPGTQVHSLFVDCLQALVTGDRFNLASRVGVLTYRIVCGDIFKNTSGY